MAGVCGHRLIFAVFRVPRRRIADLQLVNLGKIGASKGDVVLIARQVRNDGSLTARNG
jgi:hypothetical protein